MPIRRLTLHYLTVIDPNLGQAYNQRQDISVNNRDMSPLTACRRPWHAVNVRNAKPELPRPHHAVHKAENPLSSSREANSLGLVVGGEHVWCRHTKTVARPLCGFILLTIAFLRNSTLSCCSWSTSESTMPGIKRSRITFNISFVSSAPGFPSI